MEYRIAYKISEIKYIDKNIYTDIKSAIRHRDFKPEYAWIEQKVHKRWRRMTYLEIEKAKLEYTEVKEVMIPTSTAFYKFKLPKSIMVPSNMNSSGAQLYVILKVLGIEPEVEERKYSNE